MNIIIKPIITEKSMQLAKKNKYSFLVEKNATKEALKRVVEKLFSVHVSRVTTVIIKGKELRVGKKRMLSSLPATKKAIVSVKKGEKIDLFEV